MAGEREPKYFIIPFNGEQRLVKATTKSRAIKGLFRSVMAEAEAGARLASQDELVRLITQGAKPIDVVDQEGQDPEPGADPVGALQQAAQSGSGAAPAAPSAPPAQAAPVQGSLSEVSPAAASTSPGQAQSADAGAQTSPQQPAFV